MKRWRVAATVAVVIAVSVGTLLWLRFDRSEARPAPVRAHAPDGVRIRVQVLNGTKVRGLARRATMVLRDAGYDVVEVGTVNGTRDTTVVLDLSGHPDWANRVARIVSPARVETRPDSSRYLDIAVVLGSSWRPPPEPFHP